MFTTVQQIRERAGLQNYKVDGTLYTTGDSTIWTTNVRDLEKFVPRQNDGSTVAALNDVTATNDGLSVGISAIDIDNGNITFETGYASGSSLQATFATSPVTGNQVITYLNQAHSVVLGFVGNKYSIPLGTSNIPMLQEAETMLAAGNLLINSYGTSAEDLAEDGFALRNAALEMLQNVSDGVIDLINGDGEKIDPSTSSAGGGNASGGKGVRVKGALFTVDQEQFNVVNPKTGKVEQTGKDINI